MTNEGDKIPTIKLLQKNSMKKEHAVMSGWKQDSSPSGKEISLKNINLDLNSLGSSKSDIVENDACKKPETGIFGLDAFVKKPCAFLKLFHYASVLDKMLVFTALCCAIVTGLCVPFLIVLYGELVQYFITDQRKKSVIAWRSIATNAHTVMFRTKGIDTSLTRESLIEETSQFAIKTAALGTVQLVLGFIYVTCLNYAATNQIIKIRILYLRALLRQDVGWFDAQKRIDFTGSMIEDINKIQDGIGEKLGMFISLVVLVFSCLFFAFKSSWKLSVVLLCATPMIIAVKSVAAKVCSSLMVKIIEAYSPAEMIIEEVLSNIKTVVAYGGESKETDRYRMALIDAERAAIRRGTICSLAAGFVWFILYSQYAVAFWYGVNLLHDDTQEYDASVFIIVFICVQMSVITTMQIPPFFKAISEARDSAGAVFSIIDRVPHIDVFSSEGVSLFDSDAIVEFSNLSFSYPTNPDTEVLHQLSMTIGSGETVAIAGEPNSGKTSCCSLLMRLYDPTSGSIKVGGLDLRSMNVAWWRQQIMYVEENSLFFRATIFDNIKYGYSGISQKDVDGVAMAVYVHDAVMKLPRQYSTVMGDNVEGITQPMKQRIAIARSLLRKPKILMLDGALRNLDYNEEIELMEGIKQYCPGITIIIISHNLYTMRHADKIIVLSEGSVAEEGTYLNLIESHGPFYEIVANVSVATNDDEETVDKFETAHSLSSFDQLSVHNCLIKSENNVYLTEVGSMNINRFLFARNSVKIMKEGGLQDVHWRAILKLNKPEWHLLLVGCIAAGITGLSLPIYAVLYGEILGVLALSSTEEALQKLKYFLVMYLVAGVVTALATFCQGYMLTVSGEKLTTRLRKTTFAAIMRQDLAWFDKEAKDTTELSRLLFIDASNVRGATGDRLATIMQALCTLTVAAAISQYYNWKLGLVTCIFVPCMLAGLYFHSRIIVKQSESESVAEQKLSKTAEEVSAHIKTVACFSLENLFLKRYAKEISNTYGKPAWLVYARGVVYGVCLCVPCYAYATCMFFGAILMSKDKTLPFSDVFKVVETLILGTWMVGQGLTFSPNYLRAKVSAAKLHKIRSRKPQIYSPTHQIWQWRAEGNIRFKDVHFNNPINPSIQILHKFNFEAKPGQLVAIVGTPGCGKSACLYLMERFYDPSSGSVALDDRNVASLNLPTLRAQLGLVPSNPQFFNNKTVAENIAYGDNSREVLMDDIVAAAKEARIHDYIVTLSEGYYTLIQNNGLDIDIPRRHKLALARAIIRDPRVLLIEFPSKPMDREDMQVICGALSSTRMGRTCIVVSSQLSLIQDADLIYVMKHGVVVEYGSHEVLLSRKGCYFKLHMWQNPEKFLHPMSSPKNITAAKIGSQPTFKSPSRPVPVLHARYQGVAGASTVRSRQNFIFGSNQSVNEVGLSVSKQTLPRNLSSSANMRPGSRQSVTLSAANANTSEHLIDSHLPSSDDAAKHYDDDICSDI